MTNTNTILRNDASSIAQPTASHAVNHGGNGSEQNSQPRLASEDADFRQVPSNAGAVENL